MAKLIPAILLGLFLAVSAVAQDSGRAIEGIITDQIANFEADDLDGAFDHASPKIRGLFGTPETFGQMVREGYPMVWRPAEVRFLNRRDAAGGPVQRVQVTDASGQVFHLDYMMIDTASGWKIDGVVIVKPAGVAA